MALPVGMPLVMIPLLALAVWRRVRSQFGPQPIRRKRMIFRIVVFAVLGVMSAGFAASHVHLAAGLAAGVAGGVALGWVGLRLTRFQVDPVKGDCYTPNPYVGAAVTVLFLGRLIWRYTMLSPHFADPTGATPPIHGPGVGQSPLTLAIWGLFVGYYVCYFAGLLIHHPRIACK